MVLHARLLSAVRQAVQECYGVQPPERLLVLRETEEAFEGSHTVVLFPLLSFLNREREAVGDAVGTWLVQQEPYVASYTLVHGFLNLTLTDGAWLETLRNQDQASWQVQRPRRILLEIAAPNTNKPLHLGHLRNTFVGDAVANLLGAVGHEVHKIMHVNDRGIHICKSMYAYAQDPEAPTPESTGVKGDHLVGRYYVAFEQQYQQEVQALTQTLGKEAAQAQAPALLALREMLQHWEAGDPATLALWQRMNDWVYQGFRATYEALNIHFDREYYESKTYLLGKRIVQDALTEGICYQKADRSIWVDLTQEALGHKLLLRGDGTSVYMTQDLGTADLREQDFAPDESIYVVGDEQSHHFATLFAVLKKMRRPYADRLRYLPFGMVDLPHGKMKSREGRVVDADQLLHTMRLMAQQQVERLGKVAAFSPQEREQLHHQLAVAALKFFFLKINPQKRICFDPNQSIDLQGETGPFIQYTHARIVSLLAKAQGTTYTALPTTMTPEPLAPVERKLLYQLASFRDLLHQAAAAHNPAILARYGYGLAKVYNQFYAQCAILRAQEHTTQRLYYSYSTLRKLRHVAQILGFSLPQRM